MATPNSESLREHGAFASRKLSLISTFKSHVEQCCAWGRVRRGGYIFIWWVGDHPPRPVHVLAAFVEELPGANTQGATLEEVRENLKEAVAMGFCKQTANWQKSRCAAQKLYANRVIRRRSAQRIDCGAGRCRTTGGSLACPVNRARQREGATKE
jgi:hypothetical protein